MRQTNSNTPSRKEITVRYVFWTIASLVITALAPLHASAQTWGPVTAHVTLIDASGMGARAGASFPAISFQIDQTISANPCATTGGAPATLLYFPIAFTDGTGDAAHPAGNDQQMVNSKAVLSTLQLALATGYNVKLLGYNGGSGFCQVYNVQILNN